MLEVGTLTTPMVFEPRSLTYLSEASVSAVSPDWEMTMVSAIRIDRRLAVAVFGGDVDLDRKPGEALDPVLADEPGHVGGAAADDGEREKASSGSTGQANGFSRIDAMST